LQLYLVHSTYDRFLCTGATKEGKNIKPIVIPSKRHSEAVFITYATRVLPPFSFSIFFTTHSTSPQFNSRNTAPPLSATYCLRGGQYKDSITSPGGILIRLSADTLFYPNLMRVANARSIPPLKTQLHFQHRKKQLVPVPPVQLLGALASCNAGTRFVNVLVGEHKGVGLMLEEGGDTPQVRFNIAHTSQ
jgi:hypothetical protein